MNAIQTLKIGTRGSQLALWQAHHVQALLRQRFPAIKTEIVKILTSGDWKPADGEVRLSTKAGGKAQFAKEIEERLLSGDIDIAVHSMKDMDSNLPEGLEIPCILPREEEYDALLLRDRENKLSEKPAHWPAGTTVGTSSARRQAMLLSLNPDLNITTLRGNVGTRISKLRGDLSADFPNLDVTMLAVAGLKRLGMNAEIDYRIAPALMTPAAAQGAIGIEISTKNKDKIQPILDTINCPRTQMRIEAERAVLREINGSCHTPIGIHATIDHNKNMTLTAQILSPDGALNYKTTQSEIASSVPDAQALGKAIASDVLENASAALLKAAL